MRERLLGAGAGAEVLPHPNMQRVKTSYETALAFRDEFRVVLGQRLDPKNPLPEDITNYQLCFLYENLPHARKRGIWPEVARAIDRDEKWAAKHYLNSFRRALFPDPLEKGHKEKITELVRARWTPNMEKKTLVDEAKEMFKDAKIFPDAIQSYVFQSIVRFENERNRLIADKVREKPRANTQDLFPPKLPEVPQLIPVTKQNEQQNASDHSDPSDEVLKAYVQPAPTASDEDRLRDAAILQEAEQQLKSLPDQPENEEQIVNVLAAAMNLFSANHSGRLASIKHENISGNLFSLNIRSNNFASYPMDEDYGGFDQ